jgi:ubiquitin-associated SH3 domain-containing protein
MTRRELILYATPTGALAAACDRYFEAVATIGPTSAQHYPPHCTLTGFFRRTGPEAELAISEIGILIERAGPVPDGAVEVVELATRPGWIGLELRSSWLTETTADIAARIDSPPGTDPLRPKDWLHLSLAYGIDGLDAHAALAIDLIDPTAAAGWDVALWERSPDEGWIRHRSLGGTGNVGWASGTTSGA